jgi:hypothetical protein
MSNWGGWSACTGSACLTVRISRKHHKKTALQNMRMGVYKLCSGKECLSAARLARNDTLKERLDILASSLKNLPQLINQHYAFKQVTHTEIGHAGTIQEKPVIEPSYLYFFQTSKGGGKWLVGPNPGVGSGAMYASDQARLPQDIKSNWQVYNDGSKNWQADSDISISCIAEQSCSVHAENMWGRCTDMCDKGVQERIRIVTTQPLAGGTPCPSKRTQVQRCGFKCATCSHLRCSMMNKHHIRVSHHNADQNG